MRLVATKSIAEGKELAKTIYNDHGQALIQKDIKLTRRMISRLQELGITYVYVKDANTDDIVVNPPIADELRLEAVQMVRNSFSSFQKESVTKRSYLFEKKGQEMTKMVQHILDDVQKRDDVVSMLSNILISDDYIFTHSINVTIYSLALAKELGFPSHMLEQIGLGAMLHDVGKIFIPENVLQKKGKLNDDEFEAIKAHTVEGFNLLRKQTNIPLLVAHCAFQHHERINGTGYPRGIKGEDIHLYAKVLGIADVFDATTSNRVYRDAMLPHEGLEILFAGAGDLFDMEMVEAFKKTIAVYPNGLTVELSDGRVGIVVEQNKKLFQRPIVRIIKEKNEEVLTPYDVDLSKELNIVITGCDTTFAKKKD